jgi:hypothetical protein
MEYSFTEKLKEILTSHFGEAGEKVYQNSQLLQYLNLKTKSAERGSKARGSFANLYAIYVLVEDYLSKGFVENINYAKYEGAEFSKLFTRQRQLPFGSKLQNHALNNRMNAEFQKFFPTSEFIPILRNLTTNRYWINENLLKIEGGGHNFNISPAVIEIIDEYVKTKQDAFQKFIQVCEQLQTIENTSPENVEEFILSLLAPNVDARLFEIVSYAILKFYYHDQKIFWGFELENLSKENLKLYKTGRTNANDGGIDFVMKPLGRFFQVTETLDFKKYFLDIDKLEKYPITFVIKSTESVENLHQKLKENAVKSYLVEAIVERYLDCIEELINIPVLVERFRKTVAQGTLNQILNEIIKQSKVEFNYEELE